ncbi:MAG: hypothetical protein EP305_07625 [Bacteroidetes bacterium]|nr:MAG: hypothetical protein EP305_07625 [Bacteroidota bacterium]
MARQKGIIKLTGKIGDLSFYKSKDGFLAREKGGVEAERIKNDPAFARTRENGAEFGSSASSGKLVRDAIRTMMQNASDPRVVSRLTKLMTQIKNMDSVSARGERNVGVGIGDPAAKALLKGFNFNNKAILGSILYNPYDVNVATGEITLDALVPINDISATPGATHITLRGAWAKVDFATGESDVQETNVINLPIDATSTNVVLTPAAAPAGAGTDLYLLMIEFFQEVNGNQYVLKNGAYNALSIVEVQ